MYQGKFSGRDRQMPELDQSGQDEVYIEEYDIPDVEIPEPPAKKQKKKHRGPRITGVIFYLLFFAAIAAAVFWSRQQAELLGRELEIFEPAQPEYRCEEIFQTLFADPDWGKLNADAGCQDTAFETVDAYVSYMENRVGDRDLTYEEIAPSEPASRKYAVLLETEPVATFTMVNTAPGQDVPDWQPGPVEVFFSRQQDYRISMPYGCTVTVNGVALDDSYILQTDAIQVTGQDGSALELNKSCILHVDDLLVMPTVAVTAVDGSAMEVQYDEASRTFSVPLVQAEAISQEKQDLALEAVKTYCLFMVNKSGAGDLSRYFKRGTDTYRYITGSDLMWVL